MCDWPVYVFVFGLGVVAYWFIVNGVVLLVLLFLVSCLNGVGA